MTHHPPSLVPPRLAIEMRGITKRFAGVVANDHVNFDARWGEVHAVVGENGAGKSTLMSILAGLYRADEGELRIDGVSADFRSPRDAIARGVGMVYQHFMLVEPFTVAENALLGLEGQRTVLDTAAVERELTALGARHGLEIDPRAHIWQLSVGEQQRVEILRLLFRGAKILVFDEPTAVLTPQEADGLIASLRGLAASGYCVIFISHKLDEVLAVADRITVMRRGKVVGVVDAESTTKPVLARMMVDRDLAAFVEHPSNEGRRHAPPGEVMLELRHVGALGEKGVPALVDVTFAVRTGEIVGVAGIAGNGQRELAEVITGLRTATSGEVLLGGESVANRSAAEIARAGVAHVPEDRLATGLVGGLDVSANAILREYREAPLSRGPFLRSGAIAGFADRLIHRYDVKTPNRKTRVRLLSGGNQQKLLIGRELEGNPKVVVAVHPTRGVDIGATEAIHDLIDTQKRRGAAILLISEDLDELMALADRIVVLYDGRVVGDVPVQDTSEERVGLMMAGIPPEPAGVAADG